MVTGIAQLTAQELKRVADLAATDRRVRAHEQAHLTAAGPHATGGASYGYVTGPDGRRYAVEGSVGLDVSPESDPVETIEKADTIQAAANAPADPSSQDRAVAAAAASMEASARRQLEAYRASGEVRPGLIISAYF